MPLISLLRGQNELWSELFMEFMKPSPSLCLAGRCLIVLLIITKKFWIIGGDTHSLLQNWVIVQRPLILDTKGGDRMRMRIHGAVCFQAAPFSLQRTDSAANEAGPHV